MLSSSVITKFDDTVRQLAATTVGPDADGIMVLDVAGGSFLSGPACFCAHAGSKLWVAPLL